VRILEWRWKRKKFFFLKEENNSLLTVSFKSLLPANLFVGSKQIGQTQIVVCFLSQADTDTYFPDFKVQLNFGHRNICFIRTKIIKLMKKGTNIFLNKFSVTRNKVPNVNFNHLQIFVDLNSNLFLQHAKNIQNWHRKILFKSKQNIFKGGFV